ncbi:MAG: KH domain-containing protein [Candidatus Hydrogenedentales bacterium]
MKQLIEFVAKKLVDHPEDVQVTVIENEDGQYYELRVHQDDMGKVIGRDGRTAKAIRTILSTAANKQNMRATLQIVE